MRLDPIRTGLVLGVVVARMHAGWAALVASGYAKALIDFILRIHFLQLEVAVAPFNISTALALVVITFLAGLLVGIVLSLVWNAILPKKTST